MKRPWKFAKTHTDYVDFRWFLKSIYLFKFFKAIRIMRNSRMQVFKNYSVNQGVCVDLLKNFQSYITTLGVNTYLINVSGALRSHQKPSEKLKSVSFRESWAAQGPQTPSRCSTGPLCLVCMPALLMSPLAPCLPPPQGGSRRLHWRGPAAASAKNTEQISK